jgi:glycosyltransferase involved in cell wall biosynthesis
MTADQSHRYRDQTLVFSLANGLTNGGVTTWAMNLCLRLRRKGSRTLILSHKAANGQEELKANPEIEMIYCDVNASESPLTAKELRYSSTCYRSIPNPVFFPNWSWGTWASVATCMAQPGLRPCRVIGIAHTDEDSYYKTMAYYECIISKFIAVSDAVESNLRSSLPHRCDDIVRLSYPLSTAVGKARKPHPRQVLRIGYAGRIQDYQKRISDIKSLAATLATMPGTYHFDVAGDGSHLAELKQHFKSTDYDNVEVRFHGLVDSNAMPDFWADVDVAILFSSHEGLSISMIESMASGCVQIVTDVSGVSDSVQHGINGFVHPVGDTEAMADHLELLLRDTNLLSRMSQACIDHVLQHHDQDHYDHCLLQLAEQAWIQPQRAWPWWKPPIPGSVIAEHKRRLQSRHGITWKGRVKLAMLRFKNKLFRE